MEKRRESLGRILNRLNSSLPLLETKKLSEQKISKCNFTFGKQRLIRHSDETFE